MTPDEMIGRTAQFAVDIVKFCTPLLQRIEARKPAEQLLNCGTSVAANYRAACRARSRAEFIAKLGVANEESDETVFWLSTIEQSGLHRGPEMDRLLQEATELRAIIARSRGTAVENDRKKADGRISTRRSATHRKSSAR